MSDLREAARALLQALDGCMQSGQLGDRRQALRAAVEAPPPAPDELRRKLVVLWHMGYNAGMRDWNVWPEGDAARLIAEIRAMWPRRDEDDLK